MAPRFTTWAGFALDRPRVMGILNVTPDSFSDGGQHFDPTVAIEAGLAMVEDGADIVDIGGESTRPGAPFVTAKDEQARILPVVRALAARGTCVSVDTRNATTMRAALESGARIVNDVSGLRFDPRAAATVAAYGCPVVLMHMRGTPETMNSLANYADVLVDIREELSRCAADAIRAGVRPEAIAIDPGIGFAKNADHSIALLRHLPDLTLLGYPLLVGLSRKRFIGTLSGEAAAGRRLGGSLAGALFAVSRGAAFIRVHDVRETVQAFRVWQSLSD